MGEYNAKNGTVKIPITEYLRISEMARRYEEELWEEDSKWRELVRSAFDNPVEFEFFGNKYTMRVSR